MMLWTFGVSTLVFCWAAAGHVINKAVRNDYCFCAAVIKSGPGLTEASDCGVIVFTAELVCLCAVHKDKMMIDEFSKKIHWCYWRINVNLCVCPSWVVFHECSTSQRLYFDQLNISFSYSFNHLLNHFVPFEVTGVLEPNPATVGRRQDPSGTGCQCVAGPQYTLTFSPSDNLE